MNKSSRDVGRLGGLEDDPPEDGDKKPDYRDDSERVEERFEREVKVTYEDLLVEKGNPEITIYHH